MEPFLVLEVVTKKNINESCPAAEVLFPREKTWGTREIMEIQVNVFKGIYRRSACCHLASLSIPT